MTYRELLESIVEPYGLSIKDAGDGDYDIDIIRSQQPVGLRKTLKKAGFSIYNYGVTHEGIFEILHIHSPARVTWSEAGRGWDSEVTDE